MGESWTSYLSSFVESLRDGEELKNEIEMNLQASFENIKSKIKNMKTKRGGRGRNLSSLKVISEETTDVDEKQESRPRRVAAMTAVKKNAKLAQMTLNTKMRNEESVKKRKLVDSDALDKEKPRKAPRTEDIPVIANVDTSSGEPCSTDEKVLQLTFSSIQSKQDNKRNKSTLRRQTRRTLSRTLTEGNRSNQNNTRGKSTTGQEQLVQNTEGAPSNQDQSKVQSQKGDLSVAVPASYPEDVVKQSSDEETTPKPAAAQREDSGTMESGPEREDTEPRFNKPNSTFTLIGEKDLETPLLSVPSLNQTCSRQENGPSSQKEDRTIFLEPEPPSKPVPEVKVEVRITRSKMRKNAELAKENRRINEEKMLKAAQLREAAEKEKNENHARVEKEREERERLTKAEIEKQKEEVLMKKKLQNQQKAQEVEHRRLKEEAARLARLKEMEEEQKQQELLRQKLQEDTERVQKQRQKEEELVRQKELQKMKENQQKLKEKYKQKLQARKELKDKDNYPIDDVSTDESTDGGEGEDNGKKEIPRWAQREIRQKALERQVHVPMSLVHSLFQCPSKTPDLTEFFGKMTMKRIRTSSAVWLDSPPIKLADRTVPGSSSN